LIGVVCACAVLPATAAASTASVAKVFMKTRFVMGAPDRKLLAGRVKQKQCPIVIREHRIADCRPNTGA
jgi:hypothetical protein